MKHIFEKLSPGEREILELLLIGKLPSEIMIILGRNRSAVSTQTSRICEKLHYENRESMVACILNDRIKELEDYLEVLTGKRDVPIGEPVAPADAKPLEMRTMIDPSDGSTVFYRERRVPASIMENWQEGDVVHCMDPLGREGQFPVSADGVVDFQNPIAIRSEEGEWNG